MYRLISVLVSTLLTISSFAQILPAEGDTLNYRLIGFSVPVQAKTALYKLEIASGYVNNQYNFQKNIIYTASANDNRIIATVPEFGRSYTWRISEYSKKGKLASTTPFYHFITGTHTNSDTRRYPMKIITPADSSLARLLIFRDATRNLYDLSGNILWYLPEIPGIVDTATNIRDLKTTPRGTITFLTPTAACEIDYDGNILWNAPDDGRVSGDTSEYYHHEFTRLPNGNYMVAGMENVFTGLSSNRKPPPVNGGIRANSDSVAPVTTKHGTLIEYDPSGKIVWSWKSSSIFSIPELFGDRVNGVTHMNAFYVNDKDSTIYISLRDISRIIKLKYPQARVVAEYGQSLNGESRAGDGMFYGQHCCRIGSSGQLLLFNNNARFIKGSRASRNPVASIAGFNETDRGSLIKDWKFDCDIDSFARSSAPTGGSIYELSDDVYLVSMGGTNRDFIVTKQGQLLWNAVFRTWGDAAWPIVNYKTSPLDANHLHMLIFNHLLAVKEN